MLVWADVAGSLAGATVFWVSTVTDTATPHLTPIWGAWVDDAGYIEGGDTTRWSRNLIARPDVHVGVEHASRHVMVRGTATKTDVDDETQNAIADNYEEKYEYRPSGTTFWRITPDRVLAWDLSSIESFVDTPTEFRFEETP